MKILNVLASGAGSIKTTITSNIPQNDPDTVLSNIMNIAYGIAGVVAVGLIIYAGVTYVTSMGNPDKTKKALRTLIYSLVGLAIVLAAAFITNFVMGNINV